MLLIRSQDKIHCVNLETVRSISIERENSIVADYGNDFWITLGRYKTKERAFCVLDEICNAYRRSNYICQKEVLEGNAGNFIGGIAGYGFVKNDIFEMPEK